MAGIKISELPTTGTAGSTDEIPTNTAGGTPTVKRTLAQALIGGALTTSLVAFGGSISVAGTTTTDTIVSAGTTAAVFNTVATTVNAFGAATTLQIGASTGGTGYKVASLGYVGHRFAGTITSNGASTIANGILYDGTVIGAAGDTTYLASVNYAPNSLTTQGNSDTISVVASLRIAEPVITVGTGDTITVASTLYIANAPTEGGTNAAIYVASGATMLAAAFTGIGDTSNANMTVGLTINQGANDDEILALKSSDVAHGVTGVTETDTYAYLKKFVAGNGGLDITALDDAANIGIRARGITTTADGTYSTAGVAAVIVDGALKSGTGVASLGADKSILAVRDNGTARFFLDSDGDSHQDVGTAWTNFDAFDDLKLMDAMAVALHRGPDPLRLHFNQSLEEAREVLERLPGKRLVTFNDDGHHFGNMSRFTMLHHGAIRQIGRAQADQGEQIRALTAECAMLKSTIARLEARNG